MKTFGLIDLPEREVYLKLNDMFKRDFFQAFERKFDISFLRKMGSKSTNEQWRYYKKSDAYYPLFLVKKMCNMLQTTGYLLNDMERNTIAIKCGSRGNAISHPKLPFGFGTCISRLIAHCLGDGNINASHGIRYTNSDRNLINSFISDMKVLGDVKLKEGYDSGAFRVHAPKIAKLILDMLGLEDKTYGFLLSGENDSQAAFIQALFDDEGSVNLSSLRIVITNSNKPMLLAVKASLERSFKILSRICFKSHYKDRRGDLKSMWNLDITGYKNFERFRREISSIHSDKILRLDSLIKRYEGKKIRPLRYETCNRIKEILANNSMTKQQIAICLGLPIETVASQIRKMRLRGDVFEDGSIKTSRQNAILWSLRSQWTKQNRHEEKRKHHS